MLWLWALWKKNWGDGSRRQKRAATGSKTRFVFARIVGSMLLPNGGAAFMEIWCMSPFLVGVVVRVHNCSGSSRRGIGCPVWTLPKISSARVRWRSSRGCRLGSLAITVSNGLGYFLTTGMKG